MYNALKSAIPFCLHARNGLNKNEARSTCCDYPRFPLLNTPCRFYPRLSSFRHRCGFTHEEGTLEKCTPSRYQVWPTVLPPLLFRIPIPMCSGIVVHKKPVRDWHVKDITTDGIISDD